MARHPGQFDLEFHAPALFDPELTASGLFDAEWEARASGASFDAALMAAMSRPWRDIVFDRPSVVASGMTPPNRINP